MRTQYQNQLIALFTNLHELYRVRQLSKTVELVVGHDVHAFYRAIPDRSRVLHLQGYPGMSSDGGLVIRGRVMGYDAMLRERDKGVSRGNEHAAVTQDVRSIPFEPKTLDVHTLADLIGRVVPALRSDAPHSRPRQQPF